MSKYIIHGGKSLAGDVVINGAKNAALGIVAASIMSDEMVTIENLPDVWEGFFLYGGNIETAESSQNLIVGFAANGAFALFKFNNQGRTHTAHEGQAAAGQALV